MLVTAQSQTTEYWTENRRVDWGPPEWSDLLKIAELVGESLGIRTQVSQLLSVCFLCTGN